ncbi:hypothetical protein BBJ28_00012791 [Nothophytophthora sp. Chile5]|nr:hypothetical protein BBJ28_00012791 [Nothophytophthora sp. Chile5]
MAGSSLLTQGLEPLANHSSAIRAKLVELYALDEKLQAAHQQAKRDDDFGEEVVTKYTTFLACRQQLIAELERQQVQVPWQLRMTIDDLETTRKEKKEGKAKSTEKDAEAKKQQESTAAKTQKQEEAAGTAASTAESGRVAVAFVAPTLVALLIALLWYQYKSSSE